MSDRDQGSAEEEEYVLLDLEDVFHGLALPTNTPYTISGLDTLNPVLSIGGHKLIGDYIDTVGTCFIFSEQGDKTDNIGKGVPDEPSKQYKGICGLQKKLKFRRFAAEDKTTSLPAHMKS